MGVQEDKSGLAVLGFSSSTSIAGMAVGGETRLVPWLMAYTTKWVLRGRGGSGRWKSWERQQ